MRGLIAGLVVAVILPARQAVAASQTPYTPTQLEWLEVELNACCRRQLQDGYATSFYAKSPDTIEIVVFVNLKTVLHAAVEQELRHGEVMARQHAAYHGWRWLRIERRTVDETAQ